MASELWEALNATLETPGWTSRGELADALEKAVEPFLGSRLDTQLPELWKGHTADPLPVRLSLADIFGIVDIKRIRVYCEPSASLSIKMKGS